MKNLLRRFLYSIPLLGLTGVVFFGGVVNRLLVWAHVSNSGIAGPTNEIFGTRSALADNPGPFPGGPGPDGDSSPCPAPSPGPTPDNC